MKKLIILLLTLTLILGVFVSCNSKRYLPTDDETNKSPSEDTSTESTMDYITESNDTNQTENTDTTEEITEETSTEAIITEFNPEEHGYTIEKVNGDYYIKLLTTPKPTGGGIAPGYPTIYSFEEFYEKLHLITAMTNYDIENIYHSFERDDIGYKLFDIETIYYPVLPDGITFWKSRMPVYWEQYAYSTEIYYNGIWKGAGISDGQVCVLTRYEDYLELYNSEKYSNATVLTEGNKEARVTVQFYDDDDTDYYKYRVLLKSGDVYAEIWLDAYEPFADNSIFLDFDFVKYEP